MKGGLDGASIARVSPKHRAARQDSSLKFQARGSFAGPGGPASLFTACGHRPARAGAGLWLCRGVAGSTLRHDQRGGPAILPCASGHDHRHREGRRVPVGGRAGMRIGLIAPPWIPVPRRRTAASSPWSMRWPGAGRSGTRSPIGRRGRHHLSGSKGSRRPCRGSGNNGRVR
jgi:hypothetical protein